MNNFDQSSTGVNLDLACFFDCSQSQRDFNESFKILQHGDNCHHTVAVYTEFGNVSDDFSFTDPEQYSFTKAELVNAVRSSEHTEDLNNYAIRYFGECFLRLNKAELIEFLVNYYDDSDTLAEFLQENFTPIYDTIVTRGSCQGDYAEVIITKQFHKFLQENGQTFEQSKTELSDTIDNLFWKAPLYARLTINEDQEFYIDER